MTIFLSIILAVVLTWALTAYVTHRKITRLRRRFLAMTKTYEDAMAALDRGDVKTFQELEAKYWIESTKLKEAYAHPNHSLP